MFNSTTGENLVVFRTGAGKACVLDAYCPHLGANLGIGGRVVGDCIECPFHGWQFDGHDGKCTRVPYAEKSMASNSHYSFQTVDSIAIFSSSAFCQYEVMARDRGQRFHLHMVPRWKRRTPMASAGHRWNWIQQMDLSRTHRPQHQLSHSSNHSLPEDYDEVEFNWNIEIQEIPENGADVAHLDHLHGPSMLYGSDLHITNHYGAKADGTEKPSSNSDQIDNKFKLTPFIKHHWSIRWQPEEAPNSHLATSNLRHDLRLFNKFPLIIIDVEARQVNWPTWIEIISLETKSGRILPLSNPMKCDLT